MGCRTRRKRRFAPSWLKKRRRWMLYSGIRPFLRKIDSTRCAPFVKMKLLGSRRSCRMNSERNTRRIRSRWVGRTAISHRMVHLLPRLMIRAGDHLQVTDLLLWMRNSANNSRRKHHGLQSCHICCGPKVGVPRRGVISVARFRPFPVFFKQRASSNVNESLLKRGLAPA